MHLKHLFIATVAAAALAGCASPKTLAPASTNQYPVVAYSSLGYLVTVSAQPGPEKGTHYRLHLIPLPGDGAATQPAAPKAP